MCSTKTPSRYVPSNKRKHKYRSVTGVRPLLDPDNLRIACELTELSFALHPLKVRVDLPRGNINLPAGKSIRTAVRVDLPRDNVDLSAGKFIRTAVRVNLPRGNVDCQRAS